MKYTALNKVYLELLTNVIVRPIPIHPGPKWKFLFDEKKEAFYSLSKRRIVSIIKMRLKSGELVEITEEQAKIRRLLYA